MQETRGDDATTVFDSVACDLRARGCGDGVERTLAKALGSWWIKDGFDGRRIEAEGFASTLGSRATVMEPATSRGSWLTSAALISPVMSETLASSIDRCAMSGRPKFSTERRTNSCSDRSTVDSSAIVFIKAPRSIATS